MREHLCVLCTAFCAAFYLPQPSLFTLKCKDTLFFFGIVDNIVLINIKNDPNLSFYFISVDNLNINKIASHAL